MAGSGTRVLGMLGGRFLLEASVRSAERRNRRGKLRSGSGLAGPSALPRYPPGGRVAEEEAEFGIGEPLHLEPGELEWTRLIRSGLPAKSIVALTNRLGVSVTELAESLRIPARTFYRRVQKRETLTPEESERSLRAARVATRAQELLGEENGRDWIFKRCKALGAEPITLLDTADGFTAVMDELGRLEYGVIG